MRKLKNNKKTKTRNHAKNKHTINIKILSGGFLNKTNIEIAELNAKEDKNNWTLVSKYNKATDPLNKKVFIFIGSDYNTHATVIFENINELDALPSIHITYEEYEYLDSDIKTIIASKQIEQIEPINIYHFGDLLTKSASKTLRRKTWSSTRLSNHSSKENKENKEHIDLLLEKNFKNFNIFLNSNDLKTYTQFNSLKVYIPKNKSSRRSLRRNSATYASFSSLSRRSARSAARHSVRHSPSSNSSN